MVNAQKWLDKNSPKLFRGSIMGLNIANRDLEGELDLSEFKKLRTLDCSFNRITRLRGLEQTKLEKLYCQNNLLHDLDLEFIILLKECNCDNNYLNYRALNQDTISKLKNARWETEYLRRENEALKKKLAHLLKKNSVSSADYFEPEQAELNLIEDYLSEDEEIRMPLSPQAQLQLARLQTLREFPQQEQVRKINRQFQVLVSPKGK